MSSSVVCLGAVIEGPDIAPVHRAAAVMEDHGSRLVGIVADDEGRVLLATAHPEVAGDTARRAAAMIAEEVHAHPARR
jgi:glutamine amidotransferase PdxT